MVAASDTARGARSEPRRPARGGNYIRAAAPINPAFRGSPSKCGSCCPADGYTLSARRHTKVGAGTAHCQAASCAAGCRLLKPEGLPGRTAPSSERRAKLLRFSASHRPSRAAAGVCRKTGPHGCSGRAPAKRRRRSDRQSLLRSGSVLASSACGSFCRSTNSRPLREGSSFPAHFRPESG